MRDDVHAAVDLARQLAQRARELQTPAERRQQAELDRMIQSPQDKATLVEITDQAFRARLPHRAADQLVHILDVQGVPRFFSALERTLLRGFQSFGAYLPSVTMPLVKEKMQHETANVVLPAEEEMLRDYLEDRRQAGLRMNVNYLGEALLGESEATRRLEAYLAALQQPEIEVISVKISTIYSQISPLARGHTLGVVCDRLELLYRAAAKGQFTRADGAVVPKFVYLDMEEYRDKEITAEAFMRTLDREGLEQARAGIALQAYLPDSFATQRRITEWARRRTKSGGAPVTIRIVKGANMEMERVEASIRGWPLATFADKADTDANYHRMLQYGMQAENLDAVHLGVASHNLFTLAYGIILAAKAGRQECVQFEMLEGMAAHQRRALHEVVRNVLLYAPACRQENFVNAIGYLVRRLDENTGPDNFLRHAFNLEVDGEAWRRLERGFIESFDRIKSLDDAPRRTQDRRSESDANRRVASATGVSAPNGHAAGGVTFKNEPDSDWSLPHNSEWAQGVVDAWQARHATSSDAVEVPLVIEGEDVLDHRDVRPSPDPSRPGVAIANFRQANEADIHRAVECAANDPASWRLLPPRERSQTLFRVAEELARSRGELMGAMLAEAGKILSESDPEVSEAIDFCRFYATSAEEIHGFSELAPSGRGVAVVASPWNFPLAIPCGGVAAALAAGNTVILKPASHTVLIGYLLCQCFWRAGVPRRALQFAPCSGADVGQRLVSHDRVDVVILTGGTETALAMLRHKPTIRLLAETGGKNATIVTAMCDRDLAIKNILQSAFSHSGQKCSATSLAILEDEVYHDAGFRDTLCDAIESLKVGSAWQLATKISPLIHPPRDALERSLKELEPGETWAVMPRLHVDDNPCLVSPAVKWGVQPGSFTHMTELFGPVLGVMSARRLHEAIDMVNATGYGLTSGLESLDDREHELWRQGIRAGNLYINRPTTGAIVLRQPFGGTGKSSFGPGIKAGGPNYVVPLMDFNDAPKAAGSRSPGVGSAAPAAEKPKAPPFFTGLPTRSSLKPQRRENLNADALALLALRKRIESSDNDHTVKERLADAIDSYLHWSKIEFRAEHDHFRLIGEDNYRRYMPIQNLRIRVHDDDSTFDVIARIAAARAAGCRAVVSVPELLADAQRRTLVMLDEWTENWAAAIEFVEEADGQLAQALRGRQVQRLRYAAPARVSETIRRTSAESLTYVADAPPVACGRIELLWYCQEQSLSHVYHRYGNLGRRADEPRGVA